MMPPGPRFPANRESGIGNRESGNPPQNGKTGDPIIDSRFPSDLWVDIMIVRKVRPIVRHLRVRVAILHRPVFGSLRRKVGGGQNLHLKDPT